MSEIQVRRVKVPFKGVSPKAPPVPVWLFPDRKVLPCGATAHSLVPIRPFIEKALPGLGDVHDDIVEKLVTESYNVELPEYQDDGPLVSWRQLSWLGWAMTGRQGVTSDLPAPPGTMIRHHYWTIFFAQNVMRGLLTRLIETEIQAFDQDAAGEVFWDPLVMGMRIEVRAYDNIPPMRKVSLFAEREVKAMWQRILERVSEPNRRSLEHCLASRRGNVRKLGEG